MRRVLQAEVDDVLRRDAQKPRARHAEEAVDMSGVSGARLQRPVDVGEAVRVAVDEAIDRQIVLVGQETNEAPRRAGRHPSHLDDDALGALPEPMIVEALEHAAGFDGENEARVRPEGKCSAERGML